MAEPDVRVDPGHLETVGTLVARVGGDLTTAGRTAEPAITPRPAWEPGFDSVAAAAALAGSQCDAVAALGAGVDACARGLRAAAAAWAESDRGVADRLRNG